MAKKRGLGESPSRRVGRLGAPSRRRALPGRNFVRKDFCEEAGFARKDFCQEAGSARKDCCQEAGSARKRALLGSGKRLCQEAGFAGKGESALELCVVFFFWGGGG